MDDKEVIFRKINLIQVRKATANGVAPDVPL